MCFETLKPRKKKYFLYALIVGVALLLPLVLSITFGKYQTKESIKLAEGTISYKPYDFKIIAMYQENSNGVYEEINSIPTNGYKINEEKSYCTLDNINKDSNAILKTIGSKHTIENISTNDKCYLYFDKVIVSNIEDIINSKTIARRTDFSSTLTEDTTGTIFVAPDEYGDSFYYAGAVQDNWVKFAGFYWRIIRINGDGTLRMIYSGSEESGPVTTGEATQIGTSSFNTLYNNNVYFGYMYGTLGSTTYEETHANINDSTIKIFINNWYNNNLANYSERLASGNGATFCNDRQPSTGTLTSNGKGGTGTTITYYAAFIRLSPGWSTDNAAPSFKCMSNNDEFSESIGLITADEVAYAGSGHGKTNTAYYLYTNQYYWSMSPAYFLSDNFTNMYRINIKGGVDGYAVHNIHGVRPVINLKSDITFLSGDGTASNPYIVSET